jgi:hypothetical protein
MRKLKTFAAAAVLTGGLFASAPAADASLMPAGSSAPCAWQYSTNLVQCGGHRLRAQLTPSRLIASLNVNGNLVSCSTWYHPCRYAGTPLPWVPTYWI